MVFLINEQKMSLTFNELKEEMNDLLWYHTHRCYNTLNCEWLDIDDIYQEFLVVMWECIDTYNIDQGHFSTYLVYQIKSRRNEIQRWLYRDRRDTSLESDYELDNEALGRIPAPNCDSPEFHSSKKIFIQQLNKNEQIILKYLVGAISFDELQSQLGLSRSGTFRRISVTKKDIQKVWESVFDESLHV